MQMITKFIETSTEAAGGVMVLEASHRSVTALDPTMILLDPIIQVSVGPVFHPFVQFSSDRSRITVVTIRRDARGYDAGHHFCRSKELFRRLHVAPLAQPHIDPSAGPIDRAIKVAPSALDLDIGFVNVPASSGPAYTPPSQIVDEGWGKALVHMQD
jgi:hypothetical protein